MLIVKMMFDQVKTIMARPVNWVIPLMCAFVAAAFGILLLFSTAPHGLGLSPDSVAYLRAANDFLDGNGLASFTSQWPPLYPASIVFVGKSFDLEVFAAARLTQAFIYSLSIVVIFKLLKAY